MRTKTLLLTAALSAAGVATSMAQAVFSVNAVGYVTKTVAGGKLSLISNPLDAGAGNNTIANLFKGALPGTQVFKYDGKAFVTATYDDIDNAFTPPAAAATTVVPGEGVFVQGPKGGADQKFTFVGEVPQGNLSNPIPKGLSIRSSQVPQAGNVEALGYKGVPGDQIFKFDEAKQSFVTYNFDDIENKWLPSIPEVAVGEAFFISKNEAGTWTRTFSVNQ